MSTYKVRLTEIGKQPIVTFRIAETAEEAARSVLLGGWNKGAAIKQCPTSFGIGTWEGRVGSYWRCWAEVYAVEDKEAGR